MTVLVSQAASLSRPELDALGPVPIPLSTPAPQLFGRRVLDESAMRQGECRATAAMGIWECSRGRWQRTIMKEEFAHVLAGRARFFPEQGPPIEIRAGDSFWFPANTKGVWEIQEDLRKVYVLLDEPGFAKKATARARATLNAIRKLFGPHRAGSSATAHQARLLAH